MTRTVLEYTTAGLFVYVGSFTKLHLLRCEARFVNDQHGGELIHHITCEHPIPKRPSFAASLRWGRGIGSKREASVLDAADAHHIQ